MRGSWPEGNESEAPTEPGREAPASPTLTPVNLFLLHLRRGLQPWLILAASALAALVLAGDAPREWLGEELQPGAWCRRELWAALLLLLWPAALYRASTLIGRWRTGELDWLGTRARSLGIALTTSWLGICAAFLAAVCVVALVAETACGTGAAFVDEGWFEGEVIAQAAPEGARQWAVVLPATTDGARIAVPILLRGYGGATVEAGLQVRRGPLPAGTAEDADNVTRWTGTLGRAHELELALPAGDGLVTITLERLSDGAALLVEQPGARLLTPARRGADTLGILIRIALAAALSCALAIGCGAWVSPPSAALAVLTLWTAAWLGDGAWSLPGADLFQLLDDMGRGRAAAAPGTAVWATGLFGSALGLGLGRLGLARQRRES